MNYSIITADIVNYTKLAQSSEGNLIDDFTKWTKKMNVFSGVKYELFRGDSFQCIIPNLNQALKISLLNRAYFLRLSKNQSGLDLRQSIGIGEVDSLKKTLSRSDGEAFRYSGRSFDEMDKKGNRIVFKSSFPEIDAELNTSLTLLEAIIQGWTSTQAEVFFYKLQGKKEKEIAEQLNISQPAVNRHLKAVSWSAIEKLLNRFEELVNKNF
jgi:DNA-directed RNA polymerase specialized sigma subunit